MRSLLPTPLLLLALCTLSTTVALADAPESASEQAQAALQAGDTKAVLSLLSPPPLDGADTCTLAAALLQSKEEQRALLYFERCFRFRSEGAIRKEITALKRRFQKSKLAPVSLSLSPEGAQATIDSIYSTADILISDEDLWLPKGRYRIDVRADGYESAAFAVTVDSSDRMLVPLALDKSVGVKPTELDLGEDAGAELGAVATAADPRPKKFKNILPDKYTRAPDPSVAPASDKQDSSALPWIAAGAGVGLVGAGIGFQVNDRETLALVGYGLGGSMLGIATYLFLRGSDTDEADAGTRVSISPTDSGWSYGISGSW